jgi:hypothetical protein
VVNCNEVFTKYTTSVTLQTVLASDAYVVEGQVLREEQTASK